MALPQLTDEEVRTWTLEQKDNWWLKHVYKGNMPQLTLRSAITGFLLGGILSATNLYVGAKTGWGLGVGVTSVILAFAMFKLFASLSLTSEFTVLENNAMQSIATAAGYMTMPLISSLPAYMIVNNRLIPWHQIMIWNLVLSILGVLFAFPMKRRFINDEQHPFPEGRAVAVVLDTLHHADAAVGLAQAKAMAWAASLAASIKFLQAEALQRFVQRTASDRTPWFIPESLSGAFERLGLPFGNWRGTPLRQLTIDPVFDLAMFGAGGLMGIRAGTSLLVGALLNYLVLAPWMIQLGEIKPRISPDAPPAFGLRQITLWSLWPGVTCMVVASLVVFFARPRILWDAFRGLFGRRSSSDVLKDIEFPIWVSVIGIPLFSLLAAFLAQQYFGVQIWVALAGLPLAFLLALVAANSTALTGITPVSATAKITQLFYGVIQPGNIQTNLATAGMTGEIVSNSSNLLMDIKPGYMLGAKPRQQAVGHIIGIVAGALASVPLFFLLFTRQVESQGVSSIRSDQFPMPSATTWQAVAEVLTRGLQHLPPTIVYAILAAVALGIALEVAQIVTRGRFPLSATALGLAFVIDFGTSFAMFLGAFFFWSLGAGHAAAKPVGKAPPPRVNLMAANYESICAGLIAGTALMGILDAIANVV